MATAQVMSMSAVEASGKERPGDQEAESTAAQDVYVKLKSLQKHLEFLDIQVREYRCAIIIVAEYTTYLKSVASISTARESRSFIL